jgi:hypothetical protein
LIATLALALVSLRPTVAAQNQPVPSGAPCSGGVGAKITSPRHGSAIAVGTTVVDALVTNPCFAEMQKVELQFSCKNKAGQWLRTEASGTPIQSDLQVGLMRQQGQNGLVSSRWTVPPSAGGGSCQIRSTTSYFGAPQPTTETIEVKIK